MALSTAEAFDLKVTQRSVRRVAATGASLLNFFGMQVGGPNILRFGGKSFEYDVFDDTRTVALARGRGAPAATITRQAVGQVKGAYPRINEKLYMSYEDLHMQRRIGTANELDERGQDYLAKQQAFMGQRSANFRLLMLAGMMRGYVYAHANGEDVYYDFTNSSVLYNINWQIPSGNLNQLNMLGGGNIIDKTWSDPTADIPRHISAIGRAVTQMTGGDIGVGICGTTMWNYIASNDFVRSQAGFSDQVFTQEAPPAGMVADSNGQPITAYRLRGAAKNLLWIVTDQGLDLGAPGSESHARLVGDNNVWIGPMPQKNQYEGIEGSEIVVPGNNVNEQEMMGLFAYTKRTDDPAGVYLYSGDNFMPSNYVPKATVYGTVVF